MVDSLSPVSPAAERLRRYRERRRRGLSCIKVQLRGNEVGAKTALDDAISEFLRRGPKGAA